MTKTIRLKSIPWRRREKKYSRSPFTRAGNVPILYPMKRYLKTAVAPLVFLVAAAAARAIGVGDPAPTFVNPGLDGVFVSSKDLFGKGWLLLDFFSTDCEPCKRELPELEKLYKEFSPKGLSVLIFATDEGGGEVVKPYVESRAIGVPLVLDRYKVTAERYGVKQIPTVFLVNRKGKIAFKAEGYFDTTIAKLRKILSGPAPK